MTGVDMNSLIPHPVYAWMGWVQILSPTTPSKRSDHHAE